MIWVLGFGALLLVAVVQVLHLAVVLTWGDQATNGLGYFGRTASERVQFHKTIRLHALLLRPILFVLSRFSPLQMSKASFTYQGLAGPNGTCGVESFAQAHAYHARSEDVFVATQMKSGTTWMQHLVYQVLNRGRGGLVESGTALYAVSPWLESKKGVGVGEAPLVGLERPSRIIKTHLPAVRCPYDAQARYIYVVRHPVSCFASCADFIADNAGPFVPPLADIEAWFCSNEQMWWGPWPRHVLGWWEMSRAHDNVLFVSFENMKRNLRKVTVTVADFLAVAPLDADEIASVLGKCSFDYMRTHTGTFEMFPPHILAGQSDLFRRGSAERFRDVPNATRQRIHEWCADSLRDSAFSLSKVFPDF